MLLAILHRKRANELTSVDTAGARIYPGTLLERPCSSNVPTKSRCRQDMNDPKGLEPQDNVYNLKPYLCLPCETCMLRELTLQASTPAGNHLGAPHHQTACHTPPYHDVEYPGGLEEVRECLGKPYVYTRSRNSLRFHWGYRYSYSSAKCGIYDT